MGGRVVGWTDYVWCRWSYILKVGLEGWGFILEVGWEGWRDACRKVGRLKIIDQFINRSDIFQQYCL